MSETEESSFREQRMEILGELNYIVERLARIDSEENGQDFFPSAHVLLVGYECIDPDDDGMIGSVALFPKDGSQATWKTQGLMSRALALLSRSDNG